MSLLTFKGGVHPPEHKELSAGAPLREAKAPAEVTIPLSQHIGAPTKCIVEIGQTVRKGEAIGEPAAFVSAPVHSSVSGKVTAITDVPNAMGKLVPAVVIRNDGKDEWTQLEDDPDYMRLSPERLREKIKDAGIVGMGGAAFPTHVKLSPPKEKPIDIAIINGSECEPYLTADHRLMVESPGDLVEGLKIIMKVLGVNKGYIGIENNKPDAISSVREAVSGEPEIDVVPLEVKYPQGAEKMLIKAVTGREVPAGGLPMDVGVVVQNVGTAIAIYEACRYGKPLIERVVTVTGLGVKNPGNLRAVIGTPISALIEESGGFSDGPVKVVLGGPMMGFAQYSLDVPVTKGTSGVLVLSKEEYVSSERYGPCIRCGRCIDACPMGLMPSMLSVLAEKEFFEETKDYNLLDCFECGTCTYVCPSKRPIVQHIRLAKALARR
jgi:electron transport complex protein RnfC